ncbi:MAG: GNAT family N-acetyltransferase [Anaerolineae bacterium]
MMLTKLSRQDVAGLIERSLEDFWCSFAALPGAISCSAPDVRWVYTGANRLNRILAAHFSEAEADTRIEEVLYQFSSRSAEANWFVGPSSRPMDLGPRLLQRGLLHRGDWTGMALALDEKIAIPPVLTGVEICAVNDEESLRLWAQTASQGFGMTAGDACQFESAVVRLGLTSTPWRRYLLLRQGQPLATSSLFLKSGIAGLYYVCTVPAARRQGLATAITIHALQEAQALGYNVAVLQASPVGAALYPRLGFEPFCKIALYNFRP